MKIEKKLLVWVLLLTKYFKKVSISETVYSALNSWSKTCWTWTWNKFKSIKFKMRPINFHSIFKYFLVVFQTFGSSTNISSLPILDSLMIIFIDCNLNFNSKWSFWYFHQVEHFKIIYLWTSWLYMTIFIN